MTLKSHDYRRNKDQEETDNENKITRRKSGFTPTVRNLKPAGRCEENYPLYFVNGGEDALHVLTPADTEDSRAHKLSCGSYT